jgi:hypothetical protein
MRLQFYFIFAVFYFAAILIFTVYLRSANNQMFYKLCRYRSEQNQLKQMLWQKQLRLEGLINPAAVSQQLDD